jgi:hypothetical protein
MSVGVDDTAKDWNGDKDVEEDMEDEGKARDTDGSNGSQESEFKEGEGDTDEFWDGMKRNSFAGETEEQQELVEKLSES